MAITVLTAENFEKTLTEHEIVIIDFWASWCGPCKTFAPIFDEVSEQFPDIIFGSVDIEKEEMLAQIFSIQAVPYLMIFRESIVVYSQSGALPKKALVDLIQQAQALDIEEVRKEIEEQK